MNPIVEMCTCGHPQSVHLPEKHDTLEIPGHGECTECDCTKYTWTDGR